MSPLLSIALCCLFALSVCEPTTDEALSKAANCFSVNFYNKLKTGQNSMVASPFSAYVLLSLLRSGAKGETLEELTAALGYENLSLNDMADAFDSKLITLNTSSNDMNTLDIANSIWIKNGLPVEQSFQDLAKDKFHSEIFNTDFRSDPSGATARINDWTNTSTHGMISKLFDSVLNPSTVMVLANSMFFNGTWQWKFQTANTQKGDFYNHGSDDTSSVDMMHQTSSFNYAYNSATKTKILQMFYIGRTVSMIFVLPDKGTDIDSSFSCENLELWMSDLQPTKVRVTIPKFDIASKYDLVDSMKAMGIVTAFQDDADFSGISSQLKISEAIQKCVVKVYEAGSQAAVVTGMTMVKMSAGGPITDPEEFNADHPFLFFIYDHSSNLILFQGRVLEIK